MLHNQVIHWKASAASMKQLVS